MKKLKGLAYWANQMLLCGNTLVCDGFDSAMIWHAQNQSKFKYDEWIDWQQSVITYLTSKKSVTSISLYNVIRFEPCLITTAEKSPSNVIIYNASHIKT